MRVNGKVALGIVLMFGAFGCRQDMHDQPRYKPLAESDFFGDRRSARPQVEGTVARGDLRENTPRNTGRTGNVLVSTNPLPLSRALVQRGQDRYRIFCTPCHGYAGRGDGLIVQRGYRRPASFHDPRLQGEPDGYFFDVMTNGFGAMPDYAAQISVDDRWAIVAYVRALQLSENATLKDVPSGDRAKLENPQPSVSSGAHP